MAGSTREASTTPGLPAPAGRPTSAAESAATRERLRLALAGLWLLDGVLQLQPYLYTKNFGAQLAGAAAGNPHWLAAAQRWTGHTVEAHPVGLNTVFALAQLVLGIGIAWRPLARVALAASIPWALAVWALGEGFGGLLNGTANPLTGAPGAVLLYALAALLLWPPAGGAVTGRALWTVLWGGLTWLLLLPGNTTSGAVQAAVLGTKMGAPGWLASLDDTAARAAAGHGAAIGSAFAALTALAALAVWLPWPWVVRAGLLAAMAVAALWWVFGQGFGMPYQGMATDPNSGPLLVLLALTRWPVRGGRPTPESPAPATERGLHPTDATEGVA